MRKVISFILGFCLVAVVASYCLWVGLHPLEKNKYDERFVSMPPVLVQEGALTSLMSGITFSNIGANAVSSQDVGKSNPFNNE